MITGNEPAMPEITTDLEPTGLNNTYSYGGLTIRQHFAAMAMQGLCACSNKWEDQTPSQKAVAAIECADALIYELNKKS